ncbi:Hyaluronidase [Aphelenchoides bicaudatus]|nr:Hyaluronidase [Aphelenchoides bicaudatus]
MRSLIYLLSLFNCLHAVRDPFKFQVYWNVPSGACSGVKPEEYNIVTNDDRKFNGNKLVIFYNLGLIPYCNENQITGVNSEQSECDDPVNGGVPQAANLHEHFVKMEKDINAVIPNETVFLLTTLEKAKQLRPNAKWGFWEYPLCDSSAGYGLEMHCSVSYRDANKQLKWLYEASDVLLPKIYLYNYQSEVPNRRFHIHAAISEALDLKAYHQLSNLPVYAYAKIEYDVLWNDTEKAVEDLFYTKADTCNSLKYPFELGVDGVIIWGTSFKMAYRCSLMQDYLNQIFGPMAAIVVDEALRKMFTCKV